MGTHGPEHNLLHVDTTYDPDLATSYEVPAERDQAELPRSVVTTSDADPSTHQTHDAEAGPRSPQTGSPQK